MFEHFRCHVVWSARKLSEGALFSYRCQAEIDQTNLVITGDHDVLWLDVTMDDIQGMTVINCLEELLHVAASLRLRERLVFCRCNLVKERHSVNEFHHQVDEL